METRFQFLEKLVSHFHQQRYKKYLNYASFLAIIFAYFSIIFEGSITFGYWVITKGYLHITINYPFPLPLGVSVPRETGELKGVGAALRRGGGPFYKVVTIVLTPWGQLVAHKVGQHLLELQEQPFARSITIRPHI